MIKDYAFVNAENIIINVILIDSSEPTEFFSEFASHMGATAWYDLETYGNAGIGGSYDPIKNKLFPASPYDSWLWDKDNEKWIAPTPYPNPKKAYDWDESTLSWIEIPGLDIQ